MKQSLSNSNPLAFKSLLTVLFSVFAVSIYAQAPTGETIQNFCTQATWQNAGFTGVPGDNLGDLVVHGQNLTWYSDAALTTVVPNPNTVILQDGDVFYVTQTVGGTESTALQVTAAEQTCACIKEPDFEEQDDTPTHEMTEFYSQDLSFHKTCGMQLGSEPPITLGPTNSMTADACYVTTQNDPNFVGEGVNLSRTNPNNPNSAVGIMLSGTGLYSDNAAELITMTKEFVAGEVFVFNYSVALENPPSHSYQDQPFFQVRLYDQNDNLIQSRCIVSSPDDCVFIDARGGSSGTPLFYTEWACFKFNTVELMGEAARVEFTVSDCTAQGHYGYMYIDDLYVGDEINSGCNDTNFGYLAVNEVNPSGTSSCYITQVPSSMGSCTSGISASLPFPIEVCGVYDPPSSSGGLSLEDLTINIIQNGNVVGTVTNPVFNGNNFCFTLDETNINVDPYGDFDLSASIEFELDCGVPYNILVDDRSGMQICPPAGCPLPLAVCDTSGSGVGNFDLTQRASQITGNWQHGVNLTYYESESDAFNEVSEITDPANYTNSINGGQTIYVRTEWTLPGASSTCFYLVELDVQVLAVPVINPIEDQVFCGSANINIPLSATPTNLSDMQTITYEWYKGTTRLSVLGSTYTVTEPGTYEVIVSNNLACSVTETFVVERVDYSVDLGNDLDLCGSTDETTLTAAITDNGSTNPIDMSQVTYSWSTGETTPSITINSSGTYTVETTYKGCVETDQVDVILAVKPEVSLGADFAKCIDEEVTLTANVANTGNSTFEYIWYRDGGVVAGETGSSIKTTNVGTYKVEVAESGAASCFGEDTIEVTLYANENCVITQGISPNGDQYNQNLDLTFLNDRTGISGVEIFNRHGRLVYEKTGGYTNEWFGQTTDGDELGTGTYFYVIKLNGTDAVFNKNVLTGWIYVNRQVN